MTLREAYLLCKLAANRRHTHHVIFSALFGTQYVARRTSRIFAADALLNNCIAWC